MHEMSLVSAVIESITDLVEENGWKRVIKITLKVGDMRQVIPDIMVFAFDVSTKGTPLEGASLDIISVPMRFLCKDCGKEWGEEDMAFVCPYCQGTAVEMVHGMELDVESMEVEEENV